MKVADPPFLMALSRLSVISCPHWSNPQYENRENVTLSSAAVRPRCVPSRVWLRKNPSLRPKLGCNLGDSELDLERRFQSFLR